MSTRAWLKAPDRVWHEVDLVESDRRAIAQRRHISLHEWSFFCNVRVLLRTPGSEVRIEFGDRPTGEHCLECEARRA